MKSKFLEKVKTPSDINEHLMVMREYALKCSHVTEMGVRDIVSLWAWLDAKPSTIRAYDVNPPLEEELDYVTQYCAYYNIDFKFYQKDVLTIEIDKTDLLFIDTIHWYPQLREELKLHASKVRRFIVLHDTTLFGEVGEGPDNLKGEGLNKAVNEFLESSTGWTKVAEYTHNNGLTILGRV